MKIERGYTDEGTFGKLYDDGGAFVCHTLEPCWFNNRRNISCIPEGRYNVVPYNSPKFGRTYAVVGRGVSLQDSADAERFGILFHKANWAHQLEGCIAPGSKLSVIEGGWAVGRSGDALELLLEVLDEHMYVNGEITLDIVGARAL